MLCYGSSLVVLTVADDQKSVGLLLVVGVFCNNVGSVKYQQEEENPSTKRKKRKTTLSHTRLAQF